jgi:hypothetical protein
MRGRKPLHDSVGDESMDKVEIKPFVTCIVIQIGLFESVIVDERHFKNREEAVRFKDTLSDDYLVIIVDV